VDTAALPQEIAIPLLEAIGDGRLFDAPVPPPNPLLRDARLVTIVADLPPGRRLARFEVGNMPFAALQVLRLLRHFLTIDGDS
jgi:hypothetical protein